MATVMARLGWVAVVGLSAAACGGGVSSLGGKDRTGGAAGESSNGGKAEPSDGSAGGAGAAAVGGAGAAAGGASASGGQGGSLADDPPRCFDSTYTAAPSGAACQPLRFLQGNGLAGVCYAPPIGAGCDELTIDLSTTEPDPSGFHCGIDRSVPPDPNIKSCNWFFPNNSRSGQIDSAALEAVCAVTLAYPKHAVECLNYGD
jgi:hypothetical protein